MKKAVLAPNPFREKSFKYALAAKRLLDELGLETKVCLPFPLGKERLSDFTEMCDIDLLNQELPDSDILICFGGDGTILHLSKQATFNQVPILGINAGKMGFMAELEYTELELLEQIVKGEYSLDERLMLDVSVNRNGRIIYTDLALNDAVTKGSAAKVIPLTLLCDGAEVRSFSGDGAIVSTPTGSTAYSMSAGGPIVEPNASNIIVTPICAHDMHTRAFVLSHEREAAIRLGKLPNKAAFLSVDGGRGFKLSPGDKVICKKSQYKTQLIRVKNLGFYGVINNKFKNF